MSVGRAWLARLPVGLLVAVALLQVALVRGADLSAWSGGGFGMFSTTDAGPTRHLHAFVVRPGILREVLVPPELDDLARRAVTLPSDSRLSSLARALATLPSPDHGEPTAVRIQVWRTRFDPETLVPESEILRGFELGLGSE